MFTGMDIDKGNVAGLDLVDKKVVSQLDMICAGGWAVRVGHDDVRLVVNVNWQRAILVLV